MTAELPLDELETRLQGMIISSPEYARAPKRIQEMLGASYYAIRSLRSALAKCREETVAECAKVKRLRTTNVRLRKQLKSAKGVSIYDT